MKVVINRQYGGFGLSVEAKLALWKLKDPHQKTMRFEEYHKGSKPLRSNEYDAQFLEQPIVNGDSLVLDEHDDWYHFTDVKTWTKEQTHSRECPLLVKIVEEMKEKANGKHASLEIVEIPDGVDYEVDEYDGFESVHEKHRSWP